MSWRLPWFDGIDLGHHWWHWFPTRERVRCWFRGHEWEWTRWQEVDWNLENARHAEGWMCAHCRRVKG